jgi:ATP-binding cassette subfamily B (MDR/TAP) protein 1
MAPSATAFATAKAAIGIILQTINRVPLIDGLSDDGLKPTDKSSGVIEFQNVEFAYPTRPNIIVCRDYNLKVKTAETIALVGASGCGKVFFLFYIYTYFYYCFDNIIL